ncbi:uncharacterized protein [Panulirus ornatus]|uniref:uncharacterized protein n=1 Tax=Panulirus ornatus TaxID=150431 RepID=UPI003A865724
MEPMALPTATGIRTGVEGSSHCIYSHTSDMATTAKCLLLLVALAVKPSQEVCAPDCTGVDPGTSIKDPTDCTRYYVCLSINGEMIPSEEAVQCPSGHYFNSYHSVPRCDLIEDAPEGFCSPLCDPCAPDCSLNTPGTLQPHPLDCSLYYVCLADGHTLEEACPVEFRYFDYRTGNCQVDDTLCYRYCDLCLTHCTYDGQMVIDPYDCHRFYLCTPPTEALYLCPHDQVFNTGTGQCEANAACEVLCPSKNP